MPTATQVRYGSPLERIRGPVEFIDIPDILKYKAPKVNTRLSNVTSRWHEPKVVIDPDQYYGTHSHRRARSPKYVNGVEVPSRWREPARASSPPPQKNLPKTQSVLQTQEYTSHRLYAESVGLGGICSKYYDPQLWEIKSENPREFVEKKKRENNLTDEMKKFRAGGPCKGTFDEMRRDENTKNTSHSRMHVQSPVMEWVRRDVPIPGREAILQGTVDRRKSPNRSLSPSRPWKGGAPLQPGSRMPMSSSQIAEEEKVARLAAILKTAKISCPPGVASLVKSSCEDTASISRIRGGTSPTGGSLMGRSIASRQRIATSGIGNGTESEDSANNRQHHMFHENSGINQDIHSLVPSINYRAPQPSCKLRYSSPQGLRNKCDTNSAVVRRGSVSPTKRVARSIIIDTVSPSTSRRCKSPIPSESSDVSVGSFLPFAPVPPPVVKSMRRE
eukprot:Tbor_TRINITY_DN5500_c6_g2::TRINITY_DN5500_c6_g2_i4::g.12865::m.12865